MVPALALSKALRTLPVKSGGEADGKQKTEFSTTPQQISQDTLQFDKVMETDIFSNCNGT